MPTGKKFGTNAVKQIWAITYFTSVLYQLYLLNSPKLFNKFTMVNADIT